MEQIDEKNILLAHAFAYSHANQDYWMYLVKMPNNGYPNYYCKILPYMSADMVTQDIIDDIANYGRKFYKFEETIAYFSNVIERDQEETFDV